VHAVRVPVQAVLVVDHEHPGVVHVAWLVALHDGVPVHVLSLNVQPD
jgi:hypothetical protein